MAELGVMDRFFMWFPGGWIIVGLLVLLGASALLGHVARNYAAKRRGEELEFDKDGHVLAVASGMVALLLGFTFAMAIDRFDTRRSMVVEEANGIYSSYLMAQTFDEPDRSRISDTLKLYVDHRLKAATNDDPDNAQALFFEGRAIKVRLWSEALAATQDLRDDVASGFLSETTNALAVGAAREAARIGRIPPRIHVVLWLFSAITSAVFGFTYQGRGRFAAMAIVVFLQTMALVMILDLDRPTSGAIREGQWAMEDLKLRLADSPPARFQPAGQPVVPALP